MEGVRPASRSEDRMAVREMKRATDARKSLVKREVATVELAIATSLFAISCRCGATTGGEGKRGG